MSATKKQLAPDEAWERLEQAHDDDAHDDDVDAVLAMSDAELDEELRRGGLEPHRVRQRGQRIGRALERARGAPEGMAPRWAPFVAVAAMAAATASVFLRAPIAAGVMSILGPKPAPTAAPPSTSHRHEPTPLEKAAALREGALEACRTGRISECRGMLDEARSLDRAGEDDPRVQEARALIESLTSDHDDGDDGKKTGWEGDGTK